MVTEKDLQHAMFNSTRAEVSLKALHLLDLLMDPNIADQFAPDLRRDLRLAAATILRVKEVDIDDDTQKQIAETVHDIQERLARGEKLATNEIRRAAVAQFGLKRPPEPDAAPAPDQQPKAEPPPPAPKSSATRPSESAIPPLPGTLIAKSPSPARDLRAHAGADSAPALSPLPLPHALKPARPPPPMMAA